MVKWRLSVYTKTGNKAASKSGEKEVVNTSAKTAKSRYHLLHREQLNKMRRENRKNYQKYCIEKVEGYQKRS